MAKASAEAFVRAWQKARCVREVAQQFGISEESVRRRAYRYRQSGVALKFMGEVKANLAYLNEIANSVKG